MEEQLFSLLLGKEIVIVNFSTIAYEYHFLTNQFSIFHLLVTNDTANTHQENRGALGNLRGFHYQSTTCSQLSTIDRIVDYGTTQIFHKGMVTTDVHIVLRGRRGEGDANDSFGCGFVLEIMAQVGW